MRNLMLARFVFLVLAGALACDGGGPSASNSSQSPGETGSPVATSPTQPSLENLIQEETRGLRDLGFSVDDVIETSLDGSSQHVAVVIGQTEADPDAPVDLERWHRVLIFSRVQGWEPSGGKALLVYEVRQDRLIRIFDRWQLWLSSNVRTGELGAFDIDANEVPELVVLAGDVVNCRACRWLEVYTMRGGLVQNGLHFVEPLRGAPGRAEDIDGDGVYDLLVDDDTFEFEFIFCHGCSPDIALAYERVGDRFVEASKEFPAYYERQISDLEAQLAEPLIIPSYAVPGGTESRPDLADSDRANRAIRLFLLYSANGEEETGWRRYKEIMVPQAFLTERWKEWAPVINLLMAHAYGFEDFGAEKYLHFSEYPESLRSWILRLRNQERANTRSPFPYEPRHLSLRSSPDEYSIGYQPRLDYFTVTYEGDICSDEATESIRGALGVNDIDVLAIDSRIAAGC